MAHTQPGAPLYPRMTRKGPYTVDTPGAKASEGETIPKRNIRSKNGLINRPSPEVKTLYDVVRYGAKNYGNAQCIGTRKLLDTHTENKKVKKVVDGKETEVDKKWTYFEFSPYSFFSFVEFEKLVDTFGAGLKAFGLGKDDKLHVYGKTSLRWFTIVHGGFTQSLTIVTAYDTLGEEGLRSSLKQTKSKAIFLDADLLPTFNRVLDDAPSIQFLIYNNESKVKEEELEKIRKDYPHIKITNYDELQKLGEENPTEHVVPGPEDLACVMFTSGSTGNPRGVRLKHKSVVASIAGVTAIVGEVVHPGDFLLAYLPQAHILEFVFENASLIWGSTMGYGSPKTLTDASVRNCKGDIAEFRPTILVGVPAVWETVKKGIIGRVSQGSALQQKIFWGALHAKTMLMSYGIPGSKLLDMIVFNKVRAATGGRLRVCMSGGGPLAKDTQTFISMALAPLIGGYGLTETGAMGALNDPLAWNPESIGDIPACIDVKIVDFPDAGYYAKNGQGELWIKGDSVTDGYYDDPEETKKALTDDGWFMTGDIAEFDRHGHLRLIDRKKNLVKTLNGEYIALEKLESIYRACPLVANICVYAQEDKNKPIAIIVPVEAALEKLGSQNGIKAHGLEELCKNEKLNGLALKELQQAGRQGGLTGIEIIEGVVMDPEEWTPQNGFTTAAQKLKRAVIQEHNKEGIKKAYSSSG